ncbi:MAG: transposase [Sphingobacteriia bacterium]|nr:transposase [Sphingobacteriia bacterium]
MTDKFQNKYRIPSTRLQNWDYGQHAAYFVTICTQGRECYFGEVVNGKMNLSGIGIIADILWCEIKNHAKNIELGEFVVMPNHVHGILILNGNGNHNDDDNGNDDGVETTHALSLEQQTIGQKRFQNQGKNTLSSIIGSYKSAVSKHAHRLGFGFAWQSRFHDHIIRNEQSYHTISEYIIYNPTKWKEDSFNPTNKITEE